MNIATLTQEGDNAPRLSGILNNEIVPVQRGKPLRDPIPL